MLKFTPILIFMIWGNSLISQNNTVSLSDVTSENLKKALVKNNIKTNAKSLNTSVAEVKSNYNNWERQILDAMIVAEIPKEFPIYTSGLTDEQYKANIISWANKNPQYFK